MEVENEKSGRQIIVEFLDEWLALFHPDLTVARINRALEGIPASSTPRWKMLMLVLFEIFGQGFCVGLGVALAFFLGAEWHWVFVLLLFALGFVVGQTLLQAMILRIFGKELWETLKFTWGKFSSFGIIGLFLTLFAYPWFMNIGLLKALVDPIQPEPATG